MARVHAPTPTLRRLPAYLRVLQSIPADVGPQHISCTRIARELHLDPTQVRKDLAFTGIVGRPRVGYEVASLIEAIEDFLGWNSVATAVLVGAGNLGTALLGYRDFRENGLMLVAAFDASEEKVGQTFHGCTVKPVSELADFLAEHRIDVGVLTLTADAAQEVAQLMVRSGVRGIWNFTPADLELSGEVVVENVRLSSSLAVLSARLANGKALSVLDS